MKYKLEAEQTLSDAGCQAATGKTLTEWFALLDAREALKDGRRNTVMHLYEQMGRNDWWATTIAVEYEKQAGAVVKKDGLPEGYGICVTKTIAAPLEQVYKAWTDSALASRWLGAGMQAEVKDGGAYRNADGDCGKFLRVRENKDLRLSWENPAFSAPSLVDMALSDKGGGKTGLLLNHTRIQTRPEADGLRAAWGEAFNKLKAMLEG